MAKAAIGSLCAAGKDRVEDSPKISWCAAVRPIGPAGEEEQPTSTPHPSSPCAFISTTEARIKSYPSPRSDFSNTL